MNTSQSSLLLKIESFELIEDDSDVAADAEFISIRSRSFLPINQVVRDGYLFLFKNKEQVTNCRKKRLIGNKAMTTMSEALTHN